MLSLAEGMPFMHPGTYDGTPHPAGQLLFAQVDVVHGFLHRATVPAMPKQDHHTGLLGAQTGT